MAAPLLVVLTPWHDNLVEFSAECTEWHVPLLAGLPCWCQCTHPLLPGADLVS